MDHMISFLSFVCRCACVLMHVSVCVDACAHALMCRDHNIIIIRQNRPTSWDLGFNPSLLGTFHT